jgi:hypothetical protein
LLHLADYRRRCELIMIGVIDVGADLACFLRSPATGRSRCWQTTKYTLCTANLCHRRGALVQCVNF